MPNTLNSAAIKHHQTRTLVGQFCAIILGLMDPASKGTTEIETQECGNSAMFLYPNAEGLPRSSCLRFVSFISVSVCKDLSRVALIFIFKLLQEDRKTHSYGHPFSALLAGFLGPFRRVLIMDQVSHTNRMTLPWGSVSLTTAVASNPDYEFTVAQVMWLFSTFLASVTVLVQLFLRRGTRETEDITLGCKVVHWVYG